MLSRLRRRTPAAADSATPAYTPPTAPATFVVLTMVRDEGPMLRRWVEHHAGLVGAANLLVLDDQSADGSTDEARALGATVHRLPPLSGSGFERTRMRLVSGIAEGLLEAYDYAIFLDADELLVLDPAHATLADLVSMRGYPEAIGVTGLNVVHTPGEAPLDLTRPLGRQRRHAIFAPGMCKPAVKRVPARWAMASHGLRAPYAPDPQLFMLHLKFADRGRLEEIAAARHAAFVADGRARASTWSQPADEIVAALDEAVAGLAGASAPVPEFDPDTIDLASLIVEDGEVFRPLRQGQLQALTLQSPTRIPARLEDLF
ncbi:MAG: glycosyltransferase family 2 protein [Nocardioides sp.]|uniref:glycosyltransferase family 2 protein n=1 Tax=Nocardioides sp. TaxID=35761 RepID=UPI0039E5DA68